MLQFQFTLVLFILGAFVKLALVGFGCEIWLVAIVLGNV